MNYIYSALSNCILHNKRFFKYSFALTQRIDINYKFALKNLTLETLKVGGILCDRRSQIAGQSLTEGLTLADEEEGEPGLLGSTSY